MFLFVCSSDLTVATWVCPPIQNTLFLENVNLADAAFLKNILPQVFYQNLLTGTTKKSIMWVPALQFLGQLSLSDHAPSYSLVKQAEVDIQKAASQLNLLEIVGLPCSHLLDFQWYFFQASGNWRSIEQECSQKVIILQHTFSCFLSKAGWTYSLPNSPCSLESPTGTKCCFHWAGAGKTR